MKTKQALRIAGGLIAAALIYTLILYPQLPDRIPIHWNLRGQVDGWGDKVWAAWLMPGVMLLLTGMQIALPLISPRGFEVDSFRKTFDYVMLVCTALMGYIHLIMLQAALHPNLDFGRSLVAGLFLFMALVGNVLGRTRRNFWMGVRTPWTLASETVWNATHRLAGQLMVGAGILGAVLVWLGAPVAWGIILLLIAALVPVVYSFVIYKQLGEG